ncbi:MAG: hypothetical protein V1698_02695 [bacterium]
MRKNKKLIFLAHFLLILIALSSPFLFSYGLIILGMVLLWIQYSICGGCVLTFKQFGKDDKNMTFWYYYLSKLGLKADKVKIKIFIRYILPFFILAIALFWQILFNHTPFIW